MWKKDESSANLCIRTGRKLIHEVRCSGPCDYRKLLGLILVQAYADGMRTVALGTDASTGNTYLRYFGPRDSESPHWWEMTAVPAGDYAPLVKAVVELANFEAGVRPRGAFRADLNGHVVRVGLTMRTWFEIELELTAPTRAASTQDPAQPL